MFQFVVSGDCHKAETLNTGISVNVKFKSYGTY